MHRRLRTLALIVTLAVLAASLLALPALAAAATQTGPATWAGATPPDAGTVAVARPLMSVTGYDPKGFYGSPYFTFKVDGVASAATLTFAKNGSVTDKTHATLSFTPKADLAAGTHTVFAQMANASGVYSSYTWSYTYSVAPKLSQPAPDPTSLCNTTSPTISAKVTGATTGLTSVITVDGTPWPATFDGVSGLVSARAVGLANDATHTVVISVRNAAGGTDALSFTFGIQI